MSTDGRQPPPDFDEARYERPQKKWLCGHAADGCPCRLGPSPSGQCRAGPECRPTLVASPADPKGLWKCTRPAADGGPCELGPRPDGSCCRDTPPCTPVRSLRARRGLFVTGVLIACLGLLLIALAGPWRHEVISPGSLTPVHSGPGFAAAHSAAGIVDAQGCAHCHPAAHGGAETWVATAFASLSPDGPASLASLIDDSPRDFAPMDAACQSCHQPHSFHQASVAQDTSCSVCHLEHQGRSNNLRQVASLHCTACHGDDERMAAAAALAHTLPAHLFDPVPPVGQTTLPVPRPPGGLTEKITSFAHDHPEFRLHTSGVKDPTPLAFNHALHLGGDAIPLLNGQALDCRSCHTPDASGVGMAPISFPRHCQSCHDLGFDPATPGLAVPHGDVIAARSFLRALPAAYADDAIRRLGLAGEPLRAHVETKLADLKRLHPTGEDLERRIFFADPAPPAGGDSCRLCHTVEAGPAGAAPHIPSARPPDVWLPRARFDHSRHTQISCVSCHAAETSIATSDVLMPRLNSCASCHGPAGGVTDSCTACHGYHNPPPSGLRTHRDHASGPLPAALQAALAAQP